MVLNITYLHLSLLGQPGMLPGVFAPKDPLCWGQGTSRPLTPAIGQPSLSKPFPQDQAGVELHLGKLMEGDMVASLAAWRP